MSCDYGRYLPTFRRNVLSLFLKQKREEVGDRNLLLSLADIDSTFFSKVGKHLNVTFQNRVNFIFCLLGCN